MCVSINGPGDIDLRPFGLETGVRVASKVANLHSEFVHARPSGSRVIHYVHDGRTDGQNNAYCPLSYGRGHKNVCLHIIASNTAFSEFCFVIIIKPIVWTRTYLACF